MSNITKCDKRQSGLFLFQRRLDNKNTIKRESKTTGGDQVKNEQQSDRGHDRRTRYGNDDVRCYMIYNEKKVEMLRQRYPEGTRICLDSMDNDPRPIPPGNKGIVQFVDDAGTLHCKFDNGRTLGVIPDVDQFHKIDQEQAQTDEQAEENALNDEITETEEIEESEEMEMSM